MLMVTFIFILLMILFVDVGSCCTSEDAIELSEIFHLAVIVLRVPVVTEELAPIGVLAFCVCDGRSVCCAWRAPPLVGPCRSRRACAEVVEAFERACSDELQDGIHCIDQAYLHVYVLSCHDS